MANTIEASQQIYAQDFYDDLKMKQSDASKKKAVVVEATSLSKPDSFVTFIVGKDEQKFSIHKSFAVSKSPFFAAAFNGQFIEGQTQTMKLEDVDVEVFGLLVHWIYYGVIEGFTARQLGSSNVIRTTSMFMAKLWVLARRCLIPKLQNEAMRAMVDLIRCHHLNLRAPTINYVEKEACEELKKLMVDALVWHTSIKNFEYAFPHLRDGMKQDVLRMMKIHCSTDNAQKGKLEEHRYAVKEG